MFVLVLMGGCASYQAVSIDPNGPVETLDAGQVDLDSTSVRVAIVRDSDTSKKFYSRDLIAQRILPVQLFITNTGSENTLEIDPERFRIVGLNESEYAPMPAGQVIERAKFSQGQSVGWFIGFGIVGAAISAANVSNANKVLVEDYQQKVLKPTLLAPNGTVSGTVFFDFNNAANDLASLDGHQIELAFAITGETDQRLIHPLSGELAFGKKASEQKHGAEKLGDRENY